MKSTTKNPTDPNPKNAGRSINEEALARVPESEKSFHLVDGKQELCLTKKGLHLWCAAVAELDPTKAPKAWRLASAIEQAYPDKSPSKNADK